MAEELKAAVGARAQHPGTHLAFAGIDPTTWQTIEFTTVAGLDCATMPNDATLSIVLYVSEPDQR
ncbi:hypothetical protein [Dactylosporangium maewongense]|uniref:hypothetical protein n=1 Tax=Dactylosporangium maewongense TaxID=634393 RepID=UPI0031DEA95F